MGGGGVEGLMPSAAFVEEFTGGALKSHGGDEVFALESLEVGFHLTEEPGFLVLAHGRHRGDDDLGVFQFDQVMKLHAAFLVAGVVTVEDGVAAGLDLGGVGDLLRIGCGR